jgi:hypothetical protein
MLRGKALSFGERSQVEVACAILRQAPELGGGPRRLGLQLGF